MQREGEYAQPTLGSVVLSRPRGIHMHFTVSPRPLYLPCPRAVSFIAPVPTPHSFQRHFPPRRCAALFTAARESESKTAAGAAASEARATRPRVLHKWRALHLERETGRLLFPATTHSPSRAFGSPDLEPSLEPRCSPLRGERFCSAARRSRACVQLPCSASVLC